MYELSEKRKDDLFRQWIHENKRRIDMLEIDGFSRHEAIEMLKVWSLQCISEGISNQ